MLNGHFRGLREGLCGSTSFFDSTLSLGGAGGLDRIAESPSGRVRIRARTIQKKIGLVTNLDLKTQNPIQTTEIGHFLKTSALQSGCGALDATVT